MFVLDTSLIALFLAIIATFVIVFGGSFIVYIGLNIFSGFQLWKQKPHIFLMKKDNPWRQRIIKEYMEEKIQRNLLYRLVLPQVLLLIRLYVEIKSELFPSKLEREMSKETKELFELARKETKKTKKEEI